LFLNEDDVNLPTKLEISHEVYQVQDTQHHCTAAMVMASCLVCKSILGKHFWILLQFQEINRAFFGGENFNLTHDLPLFHHPSFFTLPTSFFSLIE
jgi:hypothetical protein